MVGYSHVILFNSLHWCVHREAWNVCGKMSADLAMQLYVEELQQVLNIIT